VRTLFAITRNSNFPRGNSPRYFRVQHDAISPFSGESTPFRLEFGEFPREFRAIRNGQPRLSLPSAVAPFPAGQPPFAPAFSRLPPAASRGPPAWLYDLAGARGRGPGRKGGGGKGGGLGEKIYIQETGTTEK